MVFRWPTTLITLLFSLILHEHKHKPVKSEIQLSEVYSYDFRCGIYISLI